MELKHLLFAGVGAILLGGTALPLAAAPGMGEGLKTTASESSPIDQVHYRRYRRCWRYHRRVYCRHARRYYYSDYGPGFSLYFGGGRRHWGHHRYWRR
jgi:hypothetical protein